MNTDSSAGTPAVSGLCQKALQTSIGQWMIAVAGTAVVFAVFGVNGAVGMVAVALFVSVLITKPDDWRDWVVLLIGAATALPLMLLAWLYTFALRAALFLGHWPSYNNPDPRNLPDEFHPQTEFLMSVIPIVVSVFMTCLFATLMARLAPRSRRIVDAVFVGIFFGFLSYMMLGADPFGVLNWFLD
jgi:hypothetical protein